MADLRELQGTTVTLEDMSTSVSQQRDPITDLPATAKNRSAYAGLMTSEQGQTENTYALSQQLMAEGDSSVATGIITEAQTADSAQERQAALDVASNPETPESVRTALLEDEANNVQKPKEARTILKEQTLTSYEEATPGQEVQKLTMYDYMAEEAEYQRELQKLSNGMAAKFSPDLLPRVGEIFELYMIPFVEAKMGHDIRKRFTGESTSLGLGWDIRAVHDALNAVPPGERLAMTKELLAIIEEESEVLLPDESDFAKGSAVRGAARGIRSLAKPVAPAPALRGANNVNSRQMHHAALQDDTEEAADALYGTSRNEAVVDDLAPQALEEGPLDPRVHNVGSIRDLQVTPAEEVIEAVTNTGAIQYFQEEKRMARAIVKNDFVSAAGLRLHTENSQVGTDLADGLKIKASYGLPEGGFVQPRDALMQTKFSLQKYGVLEEDITVLKRGPDGYVPMTREELSEAVVNREAGDYLAQVDYKYEFNPLDIVEWSKTDVKYNIFDPILRPLSGMAPQVARYVLDPASLVDPTISKSAAVATDKAAGLDRTLLEMGREFTDGFSALPKPKQEAVWDFIKEANKDGITTNATVLAGRGFTPEQAKVVKDWRKYWDNHFFLENRDLAITMRSRGYEVLEDVRGQTRLFAKRETKANALRNGKNYYDPVADEYYKVTAGDIQDIYEAGGELAILKSPMTVDDSLITHVFVQNSKGSFLRGIRDSDQVLNYRPGYYQVQYDGARFVRKYIKDEEGNITGTKAVAVAGDMKGAEQWRERLAGEAGMNPEEWGEITRDRMGLRDNLDDYWDLNQATGRTATKFRGQRLEDASTPMNTSLDEQHIVGPVQSLINSARSISQRVPMRDWLESQKQRWMKQYGSLVPMKNGKPTFPNQANEIGKGGENLRDLADAKSTWEYINYMENGYIASVDEGIKGVLRHISDIAGGAGMARTERVFNAMGQGKGAVGWAKNIAFNAYLATNPLRQFMVQSHQALQLTAINPVYASTRMAADSGAVLLASVTGDIKGAAKFMGVTPKEMKVVVQQWEKSGLSASIDKQNLVKGSLNQWADNFQYKGKGARALAGVVSAPRRAGFDAGEYANLISAWVTFRHRAIKAGLDPLKQDVADEIAALARNYTYNMNAAGDLPYNQNSLGAIMQFMQVPHKALLNMTTNRIISPREKAQLAFFNMLMYGVPTAAITNAMWDVMPERQEDREFMIHGLESKTFNWLLTNMTGQETRIDYSSLAPLELYGLYDTITTMWTDGLGEALSASPSGKLFGGNGRISNAFKDTARFFGWVEDDGLAPKDVQALFHSWASISSGYSNYMLSQIALEQDARPPYTGCGAEY